MTGSAPAPRLEALVETARLAICPLSVEYLDALVDLDSDPEVMRFINGGLPTPRAIMARKLVHWTSGYSLARPYGFWAVHIRKTHAFAGWIHLKPDWQDAELDDLGYRLYRRLWGQGLATELASGMISHAFSEWKRPAVVARALLANLGSQRVMEKAGMTREFEFVYPESLLPGWTEEDRRAVRYRIDTLSG
jgi:RimJ/RimL family protein N-acetyltransferase